MGHALMENRNGLVVDGRATGQAECLAGEVMVMLREERWSSPKRVRVGRGEQPAQELLHPDRQGRETACRSSRMDCPCRGLANKARSLASTR